MKSFSSYVKQPNMLFNAAVRKLFGPFMSEKTKLKLIYRYVTGDKLDLDHPVTFNEKLNWIKLYDRKPIYHTMVDKAESKAYINKILGTRGGKTIPTLGVYNSFEEIDWDALPQQFVLKATHDSGSVFIVKDKETVDKEKCKKKLYTLWNKDYYKYCGEWPYKGLKSRIIAEEYLIDGKGDYLTDFKFYTFNGEPKFYYVTSNRGGEGGLKEDFFDIEGNLMDLNQKGYEGNPITPTVPKNLKTMVELARKLAKDTYHLRVDFYEVNGELYVGELTFFDGGGFHPFSPEHWNKTLGDWIKLPTDRE